MREARRSSEVAKSKAVLWASRKLAVNNSAYFRVVDHAFASFIQFLELTASRWAWQEGALRKASIPRMIARLCGILSVYHKLLIR